jgi:hypothetical protein
MTIQRLRQRIPKARATDVQGISQRPKRIADPSRRRRFLMQDDQYGLPARRWNGLAS